MADSPKPKAPREEERRRIAEGDLRRDEREKLARGENPGPKISETLLAGAKESTLGEQLDAYHQLVGDAEREKPDAQPPENPRPNRTLEVGEYPKGQIAHTRGWEPGDPLDTPPTKLLVDGVEQPQQPPAVKFNGVFEDISADDLQKLELDSGSPKSSQAKPTPDSQEKEYNPETKQAGYRYIEISSPEEFALRRREELVEREEALQRQREMDDIHKIRHASLWPGADEQHARRMQAAFEGKPNPELQKPWHKHRDLVVGILLASGAAIMGLVLWLVSPNSTSKVALALVAIFVLLAFSLGLVVHYLEWKRRYTLVGVLVSLLATAIFGSYIWPKSVPLLETDIILIAPKDLQAIRWVPLQRVAIEQGTRLPDHLNTPLFRLENLSDVPVAGIRVTWKIIDPIPIRAVFLNSDYLGRYNPIIEPNNFAPFSLTNAKGDGTSVPASDEETIYIPYVPTASTAKDGVELPMPTSISFDYCLRLVATSLRPDPSNQPSKGGGMMKSVGPSMEVVLQYHHQGRDFTQKFRVESSMLVVSDTTFFVNLGGNVEPQFWSPDNFRASITFSALAEY